MITHRNERPLPDRLLERIYPLPRPALNREEYQRAQHLDLPELEDTDLELEGFRVLSRLAREHDSIRRGWLIERRNAIHAEQERRRAAARQAVMAPEPDRIVWTAPTPARQQRPLTPVRGGGRRGR